ncbi:putative cytochrome P450 [Macrophomina phaseolina]|uniref:Cytochrome P450 n=1 Tax=Macrophomina phaseolina TaxID=35725 RepID=A0ABQ8FUJ6_9PEZI|nr:putative cytochrome P450 [Macrophomina phaseolina]
MLKLVLDHPIATFAAGTLLYYVCLATYRLFLSPAAKFPGPRLAALTRFYEYYYDGVRRGQFVWKVKELHEKYGPVVRIGPYELHVSDPAFISTLYPSTGHKRNKDPFWTKQFGTETAFGTVDHDLHRLRRNGFNRFFSKASVTRLEPMLRQHLEQYGGTGRPVDLADAFGCLATDVISSYALGYSFNFLDADDFRPNLLQGLHGFAPLAPTVKQFPWLSKVLRSMPESWALKTTPEIAPFFNFQRKMRKVISDVESEIRKISRKQSSMKCYAETLPPEEKTTMRLWDEGEALIGAATETTTWAFAVTLFYLLSQRSTLAQLLTELEEVMPNPYDTPSWVTLEQSPYLSATVAEGLRLSYGLGMRAARSSPDEPMTYWNEDGRVEFVIPAGIPVGMTPVLVHHDESIFPDSYSFKPERWLDENGQRRKDLDGYMLSFSKGSRRCLGINLAYAELFCAIATVIRRLGTRMELYKTDVSDVRVTHVFNIPKPKEGSKGVRVVIRSNS